MKTFIVSAIIAALILLLIFPWLKKENNPTQYVEIDSLNYYSKKEKIHADSAQYYREKHEKDFKDYAAAWADSTRWDSLRAIYDSNLREAIHRELTR